MKIFNKQVVTILRILISVLFLVSALAKLYPVPIIGITKIFEEGQLIPMGFSSDFAPYVSRIIIGIEFFIAIAILQKNYLKKIILPFSIGLISVFTVHLSYQFFTGDNDNCGCFGELIPMTPIEAIIKNILTLIVLFFINKNITYNKENNLLLLINKLLVILLLMFAFLPISNSSSLSSSSFLQYINNEDFAQIDDTKVLCFFDPDCDHCQDAAKSIDSLSKTLNNFPAVHIVFSNIDNDSIAGNEMIERINSFLNNIDSDFSYQSIPFDNWDTDEIDSYSEITFPLYDNPVVIFYRGEKQIRLFDGTGSNEFDILEFKKLLE
tara:strand:+ start:6635 stop:7603 length:969 start_codon:yes stop_codon:yes gene_type:complete